MNVWIYIVVLKKEGVGIAVMKAFCGGKL